MSRLTHMLVFLTVFSIILFSGHYFIFTRLDFAFALDAHQSNWLAGILCGLSLLTIIALPLSHWLPRNKAAPISLIAFPWMGIFFLLLATLGVGELFWLLFRIFSGIQGEPTDAVMKQHRIFDLAAFATAIILSTWAIGNNLRPVRVKTLDVILPNLPLSFDGFKIAQITDIHIGPLAGGKWLSGVVKKTNGLQPDLIAVTGDLADGSVADLGPHVAPLRNLKAEQGAYFITGNHEYYSGVEEWCAEAASLGLHVLRNQRVAITNAAGDSFDLAGIDDMRSSEFPGQGPDLPKALLGRNPAHTLILLAHQPAAVKEASEHGVDLQLSGHTHGGQIWPFNYLVYLQQPFAEGLHRVGNTQVYVSPGTGFWGPPMRLGTRAEITLLTLRSPK